MVTIKQAAQRALDVQDACNLSGVVNTLADITRLMRMALDMDTPTCNRHPIVTMFLLKLCELNGCGTTLHETYGPAEAECKRLASEGD